MNIAICDDNPIELQKMEIACKEFDTTAHIQKYTNGAPLCNDIKSNSVDIIILDVDMPKENGIEIGKKIRTFDTNVIIIFCTSFPQYAVESYDCDAFYYLLKPCPVDKLQHTLKRAYDRFNISHKSIVVKHRNIPRQIFLSEIYYVEYVRKHVIFFLKNESIEVLGKISDIYDELKNYGFCQVHQGYLVNMKYIHNFDKYFVILSRGIRVPISVRKKKEVLVTYANYLERNI